MCAFSTCRICGRTGLAVSILKWLAERSPDVIVLPEWLDNASGAAIIAGLEARGFQTATATTNGANGVLFAAKRSFTSLIVRLMGPSLAVVPQ